MPAAQTTRSALSTAPLPVCTPSASIAVTRSPVRTSTSSLASSSVAAAAISSDSGGSTRGAASISVRRMSRSGSQVLESVARVRAGAVTDFGRELDAGRARADDHDVDRGRFAARRALVGAHAGRDQPAMEPLGIGGRVERDRAFGHTRNAEIVVDAADAEHERVVRNGALGQHLRAVVVPHDAELQFVPRPVEPHHRALAEAEVMPVRHQEVVDAVHVGVDAPRRDFVQQRLPQVRRVVIDERDRRLPAATRACRRAWSRAEARRRRRRR